MTIITERPSDAGVPAGRTRAEMPRGRWILGPAAALATGVLLWFGTGLNAVAALTWLAPLPILAVAPALRARAVLGWGMLGWLAGCMNLWTYAVGRLEAPIPVIAGLLLIEALLFVAVALTYRALLRNGRRVLAVVVSAATATVLDQVLSRLSPHGTFTSPAWTQADTPLLPMVAITGGAGIVALLYALPAAIAAVGWDVVRERRVSRAAAATLTALVIAGLALPIAGALILGDGGPKVRVAMVSTPAGSDDGPAKLTTAEGPRVLAADVAGVRTAVASGARVAVLAEAGLWVRRDALDQVASRLRAAAGPRTAVVLGAAIEERDGTMHNEAVLIRADEPTVEYRKRHLVPGSEEGVVPGDRTVVTEVAGVRTALVICKDLDFPWTIRESAAAGARLVLAPAWDFRVDGRLHSQMALVRAAENGFALVRPAREGRDVVADPHGRLVAASDTVAHPTQVVVTDVNVGDRRTPYTRFGDWFTWGCVVLAVAGFGILVRDRRRRE